MGKGANQERAETERRQHAQEEDDVSRRSEEDCRSTASTMGKSQGCPEEISIRNGWFGMGKFSPTKQHGECEEIANTSTAFGRRRRNWIDAHLAVPTGQVVDAHAGIGTALRCGTPTSVPASSSRAHTARSPSASIS